MKMKWLSNIITLLIVVSFLFALSVPAFAKAEPTIIPKEITSQDDKLSYVYDYDSKNKVLSVSQYYHPDYEELISDDYTWMVPLFSVSSKRNVEMMELAWCQAEKSYLTGFYLANTDLVKSGKVKKVVTTFDGQQYSFTSSNGKVTKVNGKALKYDKKGNIIEYQEHKFHYNSSNLITKIQAASDYEDYAMEFDSVGRLTSCEYLGTLEFPSGTFSYSSNSIAPTEATIVQCFSDSGDRFEMKNICT